MHATVVAADYLAVELGANVRRRSLWWVLEIGSMQLVRSVLSKHEESVQKQHSSFIQSVQKQHSA